MKTETAKNQLLEIAERIRDMREIMGFSESEMAEKTEVSLALYKAYESGEVDLPFTFIHKCALAFGIDITDLLKAIHPLSLPILSHVRVWDSRQPRKQESIS